jgi:hypothetical protein
MGWQLYFCIPSYKSNSLEETTAVSSWSQYDSKKHSSLRPSKRERVKSDTRCPQSHIEGMGIFGFVCAILCIWLWGAVSCLWSWMIMVYLWQISQNSKNSDLCVAAEGLIFATSHGAARRCPCQGTELRMWRAEMTWDQPARAGDLHGSTTGVPQGWWMLPTGAWGAIFK